MQTQPILSCEKCLKPLELCVCSEIQLLPTKLHLLILQHPQEPDKDLGTARLTHLALPNSSLRVGLSWANLQKALGTSSKPPLPSRWAVLYLGSGVKGAPAGAAPGLVFVDKKGEPIREARPVLDGLVVLDGTWSQAKTLWWRNAWLLKLKRVVLIPSEKSLYRELRKEPRAECLSTLESSAESLTALGEKKEVEKGLKLLFSKLLDRQRSLKKAAGRK